MSYMQSVKEFLLLLLFLRVAFISFKFLFFVDKEVYVSLVLLL